MASRKVVVDIETIPCPDALRPLIPPPRAAAETGFWGRLFRQQTPNEQPYLQTALNWTLGRIVCIGLLVERENGGTEQRAFIASIHPQDSAVESLQKESEVLKEFWQFVSPDDYFIGHNILAFDLPFLWNRSLVCQITPSRPLNLQRESTRFTFDTLQAWGHWSTSPSSRQFVKLGTLTEIMGLGMKSGAGSEVYDLWRAQRFDQIRDYCLSDVRLEYELYRRITLGGKAPVLLWRQCECEGLK